MGEGRWGRRRIKRVGEGGGEGEGRGRVGEMRKDYRWAGVGKERKAIKKGWCKGRENRGRGKEDKL